jgi:hypothetical protein
MRSTARVIVLLECSASKREAAMDRLGAEMSGNIGTTMLTAEQKRWSDPRAVILNQLVEIMIQRTDQDGKQAWTAFEHLKSRIEKHFDMKLNFVRRSEADAQPATPALA